MQHEEESQKDRFSERFATQLDRVVEACRVTSIDTLGIALPPLHLEIRVVAPVEARIRTDQLDRIVVALSTERAVAGVPAPGEDDVVEELTREVGRLVVARRLPVGTQLDAIWDDAFALHLSRTALVPPLVAQGLSVSLPPTIEDPRLARCIGRIERAAEGCGGAAALLRALPQLRPAQLAAPQIDQTLRRLGA